MSALIKTTALLALTTFLANPLTASAALCPSFTLTADAPGTEWNGQKIIQSGRSTYLSTAAPIAPDAIATFFRNDTTHLYATNFNISYMSEHQTPPYLFLTLAEGFPLFDNNPDTNLAFSGAWTAETFNVTKDGHVGFVPKGNGIASTNSSVGGWWVCYTPSPPGVPQVAQVQLGTNQSEASLGSDGCVRTLFKATDWNVTAADYC